MNASEELPRQPPLARALYAFNLRPADYMEPSHRRAFGLHAAGDALWADARSRRHLSRLVLGRLGVGPCLQPGLASWPLALLAPSRWPVLARHVAAALVGAQARRCVRRDEVMAWRDWLGEDAYLFALSGAALLPVAAELPDPRATHDARTLGETWIRASMHDWPAAIRLRALLKLPVPGPDAGPAPDAAAAARLVPTILKTVEQSWCSSFVPHRP